MDEFTEEEKELAENSVWYNIGFVKGILTKQIQLGDAHTKASSEMALEAVIRIDDLLARPISKMTIDKEGYIY